MPRVLPLLFALLYALPLASQNKVWIVDEKGGPNVLTDTPALVSLVRDGDMVLLRQGNYSTLTVFGKSVVIARDPQSGPVYVRQLGLGGTSAQQQVTVRGLSIGTLTIRNAAGSVALHDCESWSFFAMLIQDSARVTCSNCKIESGISLENSAAQIHGCQISGNNSNSFHGIWLDKSASLVAADSSFVGGDGRPGGVSNNACYNTPSPGGHGVFLNPGSRAELINCQLQGGKGSVANPPCPATAPGKPIYNNGGTVFQRARAPVTLRHNSPLREGELLQIEVTGQPGDLAFVLFNRKHGAVPIPGCGAALFPDPLNLGILHAGQLGAGPLRIEVVVQPMLAALEFTALPTQVLLLPKTGCVLTPPTTVVLLDQKY